MKKKILLSILVVLIIAVAGFVIWGFTPQQPEPVALNGLNSNNDVSVIQENNLVIFTPTHDVKDDGLIFYPGGHVNPTAYAHILNKIAADGYTVVLTRMPLNLAFLGSKKADTIQESYPNIKNWVLAGHSLGGATAAMYTESHQDELDGLMLWGSYPPKNVDLTGFSQPVISIYGSLDGLSSIAEIEATKANLPKDTVYAEIIGGNHAQFGSYGWQNGDSKAEITAEEQQNILISIVLEFLNVIDN